MKTTLFVQNLRCGGCVNTITEKLSSLTQISELSIDQDESKISFAYSLENDVSIVIEKLKQLGYPPLDGENTLLTKARSFVSCASGKLK